MSLQFAPYTSVLQPEELRYNPCDDIIFPSVVNVSGRIPNALGTYYLYYAPHDAPGGICLAYADAPEGPWTEYDHNPIITKDWQPHYDVSHISSPHVLWMESESTYFLYFHGENDTTRLATTTDGVHFTYEGAVVTTAMYEGISEASYARVFPCQVPSRDANYVMLFMGNNAGTRRIYAAWSRDGRTFEAQPTPLISPPPGTGVTQCGGPFYYREDGRNLVLFHGDKTDDKLRDVTTDIYVVDVGENFTEEADCRLLYPRDAVTDANNRASDPFVLEEDGRRWLYLSTGWRLKQALAVARQM